MAKNDTARPACPGCGQAVNANGNCHNAACWNCNDKRHDGINREDQ